jgi:hypothetical protein
MFNKFLISRNIERIEEITFLARQKAEDYQTGFVEKERKKRNQKTSMS